MYIQCTYRAVSFIYFTLSNSAALSAADLFGGRSRQKKLRTEEKSQTSESDRTWVKKHDKKQQTKLYLINHNTGTE